MVTTSQKRKAIVGHHGGLGTVVVVRHRIHSGGFRAYALHFVSVFGSAKAGIHRDKLGGGIESTAPLPAWSRDSIDHRPTEASSASGENAFQTSSLVRIIARRGRAPSWQIPLKSTPLVAATVGTTVDDMPQFQQ